jgi:hypothetical protein
MTGKRERNRIGEVLPTGLGLTPIAEQHPTTKTLGTRGRVMSKTFQYVLQVVYPCAFATGCFPDGERKPSLIGIDC